MAWYSCEIKFLVQFTPASLGGYHNDARGKGYVRELEQPYLDYLFGQVSGNGEEKAARRTAVKDFLRSPDCVFVLPHHPGDPAAPPSIDELRQRVNNAIALYNTCNPDLNFSTAPLGDPTSARWSYSGGERVTTHTYELTVVDRHGQATALPPNPARAGSYQVGIEVRESL
jgi:hypothetical protein